MKIYINRIGIPSAIFGCLLIVYVCILQLRGIPLVIFGNPSFGPLVGFFFGLGLIVSVFKPANRKLPEWLLKPNKEIWAIPVEQAFRQIKEVINKASLESSAKGVLDWQSVSEDSENGVLKYNRIVQEPSDELTNPGTISGEMVMCIHFKALEERTEIGIEYQVLTPLTTLTVARVIGETKIKIDQANLKS